MSKQGERRSQFPRKTRKPAVKTGPVKDKLPLGYKTHSNAIEGDISAMAFIPKIK